jgi:DNA-binding MarR family transcriptional regulator
MEEIKTYGEYNDLNLRVLISLSRCFQSVRKRETEVIREGGLTIAQFAVLEILYHKGDLRIGDIIEKTLATGGNMTVVINNLEKEDLVSKYSDPDDGRASLISITDKGKRLIEKIFPSHIENISEIFIVLSKDEKSKLIELLKKVGGVEI